MKTCVMCDAPIINRGNASKTCSPECSIARKEANKALRNDNMKHLYGLSKQQYDEMISKGCFVCGTTEKRLCIDHDHDCCAGHRSCGDCIRGVLCNDCNLAEGLLGSDPNRVMALAAYLIQSKEASTEAITV